MLGVARFLGFSTAFWLRFGSVDRIVFPGAQPPALNASASPVCFQDLLCGLCAHHVVHNLLSCPEAAELHVMPESECSCGVQ